MQKHLIADAAVFENLPEFALRDFVAGFKKTNGLVNVLVGYDNAVFFGVLEFKLFVNGCLQRALDDHVAGLVVDGDAGVHDEGIDPVSKSSVVKISPLTTATILTAPGKSF